MKTHKADQCQGVVFVRKGGQFPIAPCPRTALDAATFCAVCQRKRIVQVRLLQMLTPDWREQLSPVPIRAPRPKRSQDKKHEEHEDGTVRSERLPEWTDTRNARERLLRRR